MEKVISYEKAYNHLKNIRDNTSDEYVRHGLSIAMAALFEVPQEISKNPVHFHQI